MGNAAVFSRPRALCAFMVALASGFPVLASGQESESQRAIQARSLVSMGDTARLQHVLFRAREGKPVTVAVIGGSITQGASASKPENRYGDLVAAWWRRTFPATPIAYVNAGIGATGSNYGALRAPRDLLAHRPDFVVVEYAVNDSNTRESAETLEGLVRQILRLPNRPAVMLLFTMSRNGGNAQEWHGKVGAHYRLPMVSFRDAFWPEIQAGRMKWEDVEADVVHPNDRGHAACATFIAAAINRVLPAKETLPAIDPIPAPLLSDLFEHVALMEADALKPIRNVGWSFDPKSSAWVSDKPGSTIEFEVEGRVFSAMHYVVKGPMGKARVTVDGGTPRELDGWFDQTWGGYRQYNEVARLDKPGKHRVRFELLSDASPGSTGHEFRILGLGAAGTAAR